MVRRCDVVLISRKYKIGRRDDTYDTWRTVGREISATYKSPMIGVFACVLHVNIIKLGA